MYQFLISVHLPLSWDLCLDSVLEDGWPTKQRLRWCFVQNRRFVAGASSHSVHCLNEQECAALSQFSFLQEKKKSCKAP